jgi:hypothetical protein
MIEAIPRRLRRAAAGLAFVFLAVPFPLAASHLPVIPGSGFEIYPHARLFYTFGDFSGMLEYTGRFEDTDLEYRYQSLTLGGYYRVHPNVKIGAFYRLQLNARHDDDWIVKEPIWIWADASRRLEHVGILDITPRFLLPFLPGKSWVASLKTRYEYNFSNSQQSLLVRPGITYFWIRDREPLLNVTAQYALYLSLNFGAVPWYRQGPYLNVAYHLTPNVMLDIGLSKQWIYWSESKEFVALFPGVKYPNNIYSPWIIDTGIIVRLP